ncbi:MAG: helix-turn-helix domain-containing protein [Gemmatimonadaceae bacterium]
MTEATGRRPRKRRSDSSTWEPPAVVVYAPRGKARASVRRMLARRRGRTVFARSADVVSSAFRSHLVDAVFVEIGSSTEDCRRVAAMARDFPSAPFFGLFPLRASEGAALGQAAELGFADVLIEGVDDGVAESIASPHFFSARFTSAFQDPPAALGLTGPFQLAAWRLTVAATGRPVRTSALADAIGITREHLSRSFAWAGPDVPNLKRVIDLVRLLAAAELAKNPGSEIRDVVAALGYASSSHLSNSSKRLVGTRPLSLTRLRSVDIIERFAKGRFRTHP